MRSTGKAQGPRNTGGVALSYVEGVEGKATQSVGMQPESQ